MVRNAQMWGGLFWLAIGLFVTINGKGLGLGTLHDPGSGFALFWIGLIMTGLAVSVTFSAIMKGSETLASLWEGTRWEKVLVVTTLLLIFGFLFEYLGFIICSIALLLVLMLFIDPIPTPTAIAIAVIATFVVWATLQEVLKIQMPAGILAGTPEDLLRIPARFMISVVAGIVGFIGQIISFIFR
ncbi:MAG: tripartite tricarboxylate transporter TctB family protein [Hyphomicrobiaceae bacterium]